MGSIFHLIGTHFDNFWPFKPKFWSKFGKCMNLSKFGFKRSKCVPIRWQIDPIIPNDQLYWNLDLKNAQVWQKMDFLSKLSHKKNCPSDNHVIFDRYSWNGATGQRQRLLRHQHFVRLEFHPANEEWTGRSSASVVAGLLHCVHSAVIATLQFTRL